jgi:hypothetical protein
MLSELSRSVRRGLARSFAQVEPLPPLQADCETSLCPLEQLHQQGNLSISQILSSAPGSYPASAAATSAATTPTAAPPPAASTPQPDSPLSSTSFHSPQLSLASISTPLTSTPHASFSASRSRLSVLRSGGSGAYSTPRSDPDSTTSSRTRFALSGPWNQALDNSREGVDSFNTPAIHSRMSGGPDSFDFAPDDDDDREADQDSFAPRQPAPPPSPPPGPADNAEEAADDSSFSSLPEAPDTEFQDVDLTGRSQAIAASRSGREDLSGAESADDSGDLPYVDMPSLEKSFEMPVNFGTPGPASASRLTSQELSLVQEEEEEEDEAPAEDGQDQVAAQNESREASNDDSADSRALQDLSSPEVSLLGNRARITLSRFR